MFNNIWGRKQIAGCLFAIGCFAMGGTEVIAGETSGSVPVVSVDNGVISVSLKQTPLYQVLEMISEQADISVSIDSDMMEEPVTAEFQHMSLPRGLQRLLAGQNYSLIYSASLGKDYRSIKRVSEIHVLSNDVEVSSSAGVRAAETEALLQPLWAATTLEERVAALEVIAEYDQTQLIAAVEDMLQNPDYSQLLTETDPLSTQSLLSGLAVSEADPAVRRQALLLLTQIEGDAAALIEQALSSSGNQAQSRALSEQWLDRNLAEPVAMAITDSDPQVRSIALEAAETSKVVSPQILKEIAFSDPEPELRIAALELLVETDPQHARQHLRQALNDPDIEVSELAAELLQSD